jgi:hypothetical protein
MVRVAVEIAELKIRRDRSIGQLRKGRMGGKKQ